jgi:hypothetical protein
VIFEGQRRIRSVQLCHKPAAPERVASEQLVLVSVLQGDNTKRLTAYLQDAQRCVSSSDGKNDPDRSFGMANSKSPAGVGLITQRGSDYVRRGGTADSQPSEVPRSNAVRDWCTLRQAIRAPLGEDGADSERPDKAEASGSSPLRPTPTAPGQRQYDPCDSMHLADLGD